MNEIVINGKRYPCRMTMGALRRFKIATGKELAEINNDLSLLGVLLWACVCSASKADGVAFDMTAEDFADFVDMETVAAFTKSMTSGAQKKTTAAKM